MTYALRLPPTLDASARAHAAYLGISFNAFLCIAVEGYLRDYPPSRQLLREDPSPPAARASVPAKGGKRHQLELDVGKASPLPKTARKVTGKKETFKDRQRDRDTAIRGGKS